MTTDELKDGWPAFLTPIIFRGHPGSGKTTTARKMFPALSIYEADQYFTRDNGYFFDPKYLKDAHEWCFQMVRRSIECGIPCVVANTFTRRWELAKYLDRWPNAIIFRCAGDYPNTHGVPHETVLRMKERIEPVPGEIILPSLA